MGDLLGSPLVAPLFRFFFFFKNADPFHFICCGCRMRPDQHEERVFKSEHDGCLGESSTRMGDLLGSPRVPPPFRFFFFFKSAEPFHFICCGRRMRPDQPEERVSKSGLSAMFTRNCQKFPTGASWPLKPLQMPLFTATQGRNPRWHAAMKLVELPSVLHA